ncbi:MAG TPA: hypothetical protein VKH45_11640 [Candidatus Acidoferrum sp.]|nr:hypothetical protein [Candidatus Acidoferrum sp.]
MNEKLRHGDAFFGGQIVLLGAVVALCRVNVFPKLVAVAFVPVLLRGTLWFLRGRQPLDVHKLGFAELTQALLFGALLCAAYLL